MPPAGERRVLVADHRQVARYRHRPLPQRRERAVARLVVRDKQGGRAPPGGQRQQRPDRRAAGIRAERHGQRQLLAHRDASRLHGQPVALHPLAAGLHVRRPGDDGNPAMTPFQQVFGGRTAAGDLVAEHAVARRVLGPPGQVHGRRAALAELPGRLAVGTDDDDARRAVVRQDAQGRPLLHRVAARHRQHELVATPGELPLHDLGNRLEAGVDQVGHDQPDKRRSGRAQGTRADVRPVSELRRGGPDLGHGLLAHPARTAQRARGRADRHPAAPGHLP